jgi:hypothetical protein
MASSPSIVVRVLADLKNFDKAFASSTKGVEAAIGKVHGAFGGMLGALNQTGVLGPFGDALNAVDQGLGAIAEHGKTVGTVMLGVGGAMAGLGAGLQALGSKERAAHQQLQAAVENTGKSYDDYAGQIEAAIKHMERFGFTADKTDDALRILTQATHDPQKALDVLGIAANVAKGKHEDLNTAATQVARVFNGNKKLLKEYGITVDENAKKTGDYSGVVARLGQVTAGQADAATNTFSGHIAALRARLEDATAAFGQKYGPAITAAGTAMAGLGAAMTVLPVLISGIGAAFAFLVSPIGLVILAIAAIGIAIYVIYRNWDTIWAAMKATVEAVWHFIAQWWPLLLPILFGPVGLAAALIIKNFDTIKAVVADAVGFIVAVWNDLVGFFSRIIGIIGFIIVSPWRAAADAAGLVAYLVVAAWNGVVGFFAGMPGRLAGTFAGMWNGIYDAFRSVINGVIDLWNRLHFTLPKVDILGVHIGGDTIGVPAIPHMATGGIVTAPTLALLGERGPEAVVPLGRGMGPAVHIDNVNLHDGADIDLLLQKIHFATMAGRL